MDLDEYKKRYSGNNAAAPGWDAIDAGLAGIYGTKEPQHWGTLLKGFLGGPDPIDGISVYDSCSGGIPHFHFCSYGFSSLYYDEESVGKDYSKFGFELTFRLANKGQPKDDQVWVCNLIQNLARYVFESGKWFEEFHWIPANGPIRLEFETDLVGLIFVTDPELPPLDTPHGRVEFLQMVGITSSELADITAKRRSSRDVIEALRKTDQFLITDLERRNG